MGATKLEPGEKLATLPVKIKDWDRCRALAKKKGVKLRFIINKFIQQGLKLNKDMK